MTYTTTDLGLQLPVPGSGEKWSTAVYNANLQKLEAAITAQANTGKPFGIISRGTGNSRPDSGAIFAPETALTWDPSTRELRGGMVLDAKGQAFTAPLDGEYELDGSLQWDASSNGYRSLWWVKNPTDANAANAGEIGTKAVASANFPPVSGDSTSTRLTRTVTLLKNDKVVLWARQVSGGPLNVSSASNQQGKAASFVSVRYIGPST